MNIRNRLKMHIRVSVLFSLGTTLLVSAQQGKFSLDQVGLLVALSTVISLGFIVGAFRSSS